ncbi:MAG: hypothetical protein V1800_14180 [Candidatus Latescibacterota bacterium]
MRPREICMLVGCFLCLCGGSGGALAEEVWLYPFESATFDLSITMELGGQKMEADGQGWYKRDMLRWDRVLAGQHISSRYDGHRAYDLLVGRGIALEIPPSQMRITPEGIPEYRKYKGWLVGFEAIDGRTADIYEYERTVQQPGRPPGSVDRVKDWIWRGKELQVKSIVSCEQGVVTTVLANIVVNATVPDSLFQIPKALQNSVRLLEADKPNNGLPAPGMESPQIRRSDGASFEGLPRGVPIYPGSEIRARRQMAGGRIIVVAYTSPDSLTQIARFYETRMKEMGWIVRGGYEEEAYAISCQKGIASCRITVSQLKKKRRIGIEIQ